MKKREFDWRTTIEGHLTYYLCKNMRFKTALVIRWNKRSEIWANGFLGWNLKYHITCFKASLVYKLQVSVNQIRRKSHIMWGFIFFFKDFALSFIKKTVVEKKLEKLKRKHLIIGFLLTVRNYFIGNYISKARFLRHLILCRTKLQFKNEIILFFKIKNENDTIITIQW